MTIPSQTSPMTSPSMTLGQTVSTSAQREATNPTIYHSPHDLAMAPMNMSVPMEQASQRRTSPEPSSYCVKSSSENPCRISLSIASENCSTPQMYSSPIPPIASSGRDSTCS